MISAEVVELVRERAHAGGQARKAATKPAINLCVLRQSFFSKYLEAIDAKSHGGDLLHPDEAPDHERPDRDVQRKVDEVHRALVRPGFPDALCAGCIFGIKLRVGVEGWGYGRLDRTNSCRYKQDNSTKSTTVNTWCNAFA